MRSVRYMIAETVMRLSGYKKLFNLDEEKLNARMEKAKSKRKTSPPRFMSRRHRVHELTINERPCHIVTPKKGEPYKKVILFLHGGGMFIEMTVFHWIVVSKLVKRLGAEVWIPAYPLAPDNSFEDATEMLSQVYRQMLEQYAPGQIVFLGDSSGAALSLMLCHHNKRSTRPLSMPEKVILVSPGMVTGIDAQMREEMNRILPHDPMLGTGFMDAIAGIMSLQEDQEDYFSSPYNGDLSGFPPVFIFSGTYEIFYAQMQTIVRRLEEAGVSVKLIAGEKMMHVWPYMPISPESKQALHLIIDIIKADV